MGVRVRKRGKDYYLYICYKGRRTAKKVGRDRDLAELLARKVEYLIACDKLGLDIFEKKPTFREYARAWLDLIEHDPNRTSNTRQRYEELLKKYVLPSFGGTPVTSITKKHVRAFFLRLMRKYSPGTVELIRTVVAGPLNLAVEDEVIQANPCYGLTLKLKKKTSPTYDVYDVREVALFLEASKRYGVTYYALFSVLFKCGLRLGEALALKWEDVDFNSGFIMVRGSFRRGKLSKTTKTKKFRRVDMPPSVKEALLELHKKAYSILPGTTFVFQHPEKEEPISQNTVRNVFKRTAAKAGLRAIRIHDARHTYASLLLSSGTPVNYVKEQLAHSSISMTVDRYGHYINFSLDGPPPVSVLDRLTSNSNENNNKEGGVKP